MDVEVGVNPQMAAALGLVEPGTDVIGVGDQLLDAGQRLDEAQHRLGVHLGEERAQRRRVHLVRLPFVFQPLLRAIVIFAVARRLGPFGDEAAQHLGVDEVVEDDMRERIGGGVAVVERRPRRDALRLIERDDVIR